MKENSQERSIQISCFFFDFTAHSVHSTKFQHPVTILLYVVNATLVLPTTPSLHSAPSELRLRCLACADFMNGLISEPLVLVHLIGEATRDGSLFCALGVNNRPFITANVTVILVSLVIVMLIFYNISRIVSYHRVQIQAQVIPVSQSVREST